MQMRWTAAAEYTSSGEKLIPDQSHDDGQNTSYLLPAINRRIETDPGVRPLPTARATTIIGNNASDREKATSC
jgi:hypothetical protein